jgi:hypothetical protein
MMERSFYWGRKKVDEAGAKLSTTPRVFVPEIEK